MTACPNDFTENFFLFYSTLYQLKRIPTGDGEGHRMLFSDGA